MAQQLIDALAGGDVRGSGSQKQADVRETLVLNPLDLSRLSSKRGREDRGIRSACAAALVFGSE